MQISYDLIKIRNTAFYYGNKSYVTEYKCFLPVISIAHLVDLHAQLTVRTIDLRSINIHCALCAMRLSIKRLLE